ncbi:hypothetical protein Cob_v012378 [Colletotrichum orbiculare MAFF 240422]|uniref:Uncharacterized protein n=1 Tax=Colletotrichum orbiculare (strain 104-T / ATCC 96160 / CBS 514.97 / LARS 414 / MAFF 240422) TaxID=1213857 RepID=N4VBF7_COLOR|nr:hypothetical protein Cob_v012378 [Colletotrichum orbiculare MAFF 240422]
MDARDEAEDDFDEEYDVPLHHKRPFGAGIERQPIKFVKASDPNLKTTETEKTTKSGSSIGDFYLNLVLPKEKRPLEIPKPAVCAVCDLPLVKDDAVKRIVSDGGKAVTSQQKHEASIAHQVCLAHSHPPSALDRTRMGLTYLESHGWDPDSRRGLGVLEQGVQYPIKTQKKDDKLGLGLKVPKEVIGGKIEKKAKPQKMDAKQCRKQAEEDKRKAERLRELFYGSEDVDRYLGRG